ncbi:hypothetical protein MIR68_011435 [Amoeboaphelidium protococcarum]|nr:hypothetical protein MIR68_011435 [Amoeboaphelidium protococcarum]
MRRGSNGNNNVVNSPLIRISSPTGPRELRTVSRSSSSKDTLVSLSGSPQSKAGASVAKTQDVIAAPVLINNSNPSGSSSSSFNNNNNSKRQSPPQNSQIIGAAQMPEISSPSGEQPPPLFQFVNVGLGDCSNGSLAIFPQGLQYKGQMLKQEINVHLLFSDTVSVFKLSEELAVEVGLLQQCYKFVVQSADIVDRLNDALQITWSQSGKTLNESLAERDFLSQIDSGNLIQQQQQQQGNINYVQSKILDSNENLTISMAMGLPQQQVARNGRKPAISEEGGVLKVLQLEESLSQGSTTVPSSNKIQNIDNERLGTFIQNEPVRQQGDNGSSTTAGFLSDQESYGRQSTLSRTMNAARSALTNRSAIRKRVTVSNRKKRESVSGKQLDVPSGAKVNPNLPQKPVGCNCSSHLKYVVADEVVRGIDSKQLDSLLFHKEGYDFMFKFFQSQGADLPKEYLEWGDQKRSLDYLVTVKLPMQSPSKNKCIEQQTIVLREEYRSVYEKCTKTPTVPYGDAFETLSRFCISYESPNSARLKVSLVVNFQRKVLWEKMIDKGAMDGVEANTKALIASIRQLVRSKSPSDTELFRQLPAFGLKGDIPVTEVDESGIESTAEVLDGQQASTKTASTFSIGIVMKVLIVALLILNVILVMNNSLLFMRNTYTQRNLVSELGVEYYQLQDILVDLKSDRNQNPLYDVQTPFQRLQLLQLKIKEQKVFIDVLHEAQ